MRIGIDISFLSKEKVGVDFYVFNILKDIAEIDKDNEYFLYSCKEVPEEFIHFSEINKNFKFRISSKWKGLRLPWTQFRLPFILKRDKIDIFHAPCFWGPVVCPCPVIITFYDTTSWIFPRMFRLRHQIIYHTLVPYLARKADRIIAISENSRKDIIRIFGLPAKRISVVYGAVDEIFRPVEDRGFLEEIKKKYEINSDYILYVGILEPRKNIPHLIRAYKEIKEETKIEHKLVIAGRKGWGWEDIFRQIRELGLEDEVIFTDYVITEDLVLLYNAASVFVYPSLYEGFGLPPLEALACGTPVIVSNVSSLPEVVGNAALVINPEDTEELKQSILKVIRDNIANNEFRKAGIEQAKKFSWEESARKTIAVYEEVYKSQAK